MGAALSLLWVSFAAPYFLTIVGESAEGHDKLYDAPAWSPFDWLGDGMYLLVPTAAAAMPGMAAWSLGAPLPGAALIGAGVGAAWLIFPVAMLGALLESTPAGVLSPRLMSSLVRAPGPWLLFYLETALLAGAVGAAAWGIITAGPTAAWTLALIGMAAAVLYMRLLGRLAWWLSESMPELEIEDRKDDAAAAHPHLAADLAAKAAAREAEAAAQAK
jgi:hypothetical protein